MKSITEISEIKDRRVILSTLWIFVTANYIFCDVLSNMMPVCFEGINRNRRSGRYLINSRFPVGICHLYGDPICHDSSFPSIEIQGKSFDKYHRWFNNVSCSNRITVYWTSSAALYILFSH